jgi:hypothetical protein
MFGFGHWVRYASDHLEAFAHGHKKGAIETTFSELLKLDKVFWAPLDGSGSKISKFFNVEQPSTLGKPQLFVPAKTSQQVQHSGI